MIISFRRIKCFLFERCFVELRLIALVDTG